MRDVPHMCGEGHKNIGWHLCKDKNILSLYIVIHVGHVSLSHANHSYTIHILGQKLFQRCSVYGHGQKLFQEFSEPLIEL